MSTVLLVEDNSAIIMGLEYLLKENGYEVLIAQSKTEALRIIDDDSKIDIILLDIMLPDGDGFLLCRYIKEKDKAPVIFLPVQRTTFIPFSSSFLTALSFSLGICPLLSVSVPSISVNNILYIYFS